ncbi:MAG: hypothetical protein JWQ21_3972 [Herminiimonas sp.]|nr:hypothetical protein [Herminiimonas sp.]
MHSKCALTTASRSGLSVTAPIGVQLRVLQDQRRGLLPPAKGKSTAHQRPVATNGAITADHEIGSAQLLLHVPVACLHPVSQPVQPHDFLDGCLLGRQVGGQIPGGLVRQGPPVRGDADGAHRFRGPIAKQGSSAARQRST